MATPPKSTSNGRLRLALPSDGALEEPAQRFLADAGMAVLRPSPRRYTATIPSVPRVDVIFQRSSDIPAKVDEESADLGLVGIDRYYEYRQEDGDTLLVMQDLGFGPCELVFAVPDAWVDVDSMSDLGDLAVEFRENGRELRIATKYPRMARRHLFGHGVNYFSLATVSGALEASVAMGYADLIVDITASGTTLRENRLKRLRDGTVIASEGCLVGNRRLLCEDPSKLETAREIIERIEARRNAAGYYRVTANIQDASEEAVAARVLERPETAGLSGPTVARVYSADGQPWYAATVYAPKRFLTTVVDHFRAIGGASVTVTEAAYVFRHESPSYRMLLELLYPGAR